jgi:protein TonB
MNDHVATPTASGRADTSAASDTGLRLAARDALAGSPPARRGVDAAALVLAAALHVVITLALLAGEEPVGAGGTDLEAISLEVAVVPASALESRAAPLTAETAAPSSAVDAVDGAPEASAAGELGSPAPPPPEPKPEPERETAPPEETERPPSEPPPRLALPPDPAPLAPDAPTLPVRIEPSPPEPERPPPREDETKPSEAPAPPTTPPEETAERKTVPPDTSTPETKPETAAPGASAAAAAAGGAAARASAAESQPRCAAAAASPGATRAFARSVAEALARTRPKGRRGLGRGTVRVAFVVSESGVPASVRVAQSSGNPALDEAALDAVRRARFPSPPAGMTAQQRSFVTPYDFR